MKAAALRSLYSLTMRLLLPAQFIRLWLRGRKLPAYRRRWLERLALSPSSWPAEPRLWIHAVSVGEVNAAAPLIRRLLDKKTPCRILVTTTTPTGSRTLRQHFPDQIEHCYFPFDLPGVMRRFLRKTRPALLMIMETELWPNCLEQCRRSGIPVAIANARLSEKSLRGYRKIAPLTQAALASVTRLFAQGKADAERFIQLGARPEQVEVIGNLKFHIDISASDKKLAEQMKNDWRDHDFVWLAASTHPGEDEILIQAHRALLETVPTALLVLAPRHPDRFDQVADLCQRTSLLTARRSTGDPVAPDTRIYLADTLGELTGLYGAADAAFIAGSLTDIGGHNPLEPAAHGIPILSGPNVHNFAQIYAEMTEANAAALVHGPQELTDWLQKLATDNALKTRLGQQAHRYLQTRSSGLETLLDWIAARTNCA